MAQQNHHYLKQFGSDSGSIAWWSVSPTRKVLIFVHGFGGGPVSTWDGFPILLLDDPDFAGWDLIFWAYESKRAQAFASAQYFYRMLSTLLDAPERNINDQLRDSDERPANFNFDEVVLVTHSLGAALTRQAQIFAFEDRKPWISKTSIVCFAPAHMGARVPLLLKESLGGKFLAKLSLNTLRLRWPVLDDLEEGSDFLRELSEGIQTAIGEGPTRPYIARCVVFGQFENVVKVAPPFLSDPRPLQIEKCGHLGVCKPNRNKPEPYTFLKEAL